MLIRVITLAALIFLTAGSAAAQSSLRSAEAVFTRAQALASEGNSAAGRALIDSVIKATSPTSPVYPQALYWKATLATSAAEAESDYRHIVVDYPLAPQAEDALLRLAQLELARGDRDDALVHLRRIPRDYPRSKSIARANYWMARVLFEKNDVAGACAANATALTQTTDEEIELRNQIQYQGQRCASYGAQKPADAAPKSPPGAPPKSADSSVAAVAEASPVPVPASEPPAASLPAPPASRAAAAPARTYSVQVAAYNRKAQAEKLVETLGSRGYAARVDGTAAPFRVRIGRYSTAREAEAALREIKSKKMAGFVVRAP